MWDCNGVFVGASCSYKEFALDATSMEACALHEGLRLADEMCTHSVAVECD